MNFFYKICDALCVNVFEYIFHWRSTKLPATDSSKINTYSEKVLNSERGLTSRTYWLIIPWKSESWLTLTYCHGDADARIGSCTRPPCRMMLTHLCCLMNIEVTLLTVILHHVNPSFLGSSLSRACVCGVLVSDILYDPFWV